MSQRGQASIEWTAIVLVVGIALLAGAGAGAALDAPWFGRGIRCAVLAGCRGEDATLDSAYGADAAAFVRAYAPGLVYERGTLTLPVDFRTCRSHRCADAPDAPGADVWRSDRGRQATVFTHAIDRRSQGGDLVVQYWLFYPDSTYNGTARAIGGLRIVADTPAGAIARRIAGHHRDDWESYQVRITVTGEVLARASAHSGYAGRRRWPNLNELPVQPPVSDLPRRRVAIRRRTGAWVPATGWTRVSRASHAGHIVTGPGGERRTASNGVALVPIELLSPAERAQPFAVVPPWDKPVFSNPARNDT